VVEIHKVVDELFITTHQLLSADLDRQPARLKITTLHLINEGDPTRRPRVDDCRPR